MKMTKAGVPQSLLQWCLAWLKADRRPIYPFDAKDVPGDYVLRGDGWWVPHP